MAASSMVLLALLCVSLVQVLVGAQHTCTSTNASALRVTFDSHQNHTGSWIHSLGLMNRGLPKGGLFSKRTDLWTVDVDYTPEICGVDNKDSLNVLISFSINPVVKRNPDYKFIPGKGYYKFHPAVITWAAAKAACEKEDAHLAIINSQEEADLMAKLLVNASNTWTFVGLIKNDAKGEFTTIFGDPISATGFSKWRTGVNPVNAAAASVAVIHKSEGTFSYTDFTTGKFDSVCEQDL